MAHGTLGDELNRSKYSEVSISGLYSEACERGEQREEEWAEPAYAYASLSGDFMALLPMYLYFENSAKEFHPHETLSTRMKLLSSLFINTVLHQPI
jgi:hypothetical protein